MKKTIAATLITTGILCFPFTAGADESPDICKEITLASMQTHVPIPPATIVSKQPVNGICEVILDINGQYVPVYAGKNFIIAGEMFQGKKQITQARLDDLKAENFLSVLPGIEKCIAMTCAPQGEIKHTIYMITDPACPFCHQAEAQLKEFAETHAVEFKIMFFSVHPPVGRQKAIEAVCRKLSLEEYITGTWMDENTTEKHQCDEGKNLIADSEEITEALGLDGVPVFFLENGHRIDGADMQALERALSSLDVAVSDAK